MIDSLNLAQLLGKALSDPAVRKVLTSFSEVPFITDFSEDNPYEVFRSYRNAGISIALEGSQEFLTGIWLYSEGEKGYRQFEGKLPGGLRFGDDISTVIQALGPPAFSKDHEANRVPGARKESSRGYVVDGINYSFLFDECDKLVRATFFLHPFRRRKILGP
jgi:hypothetical protein